MKTVNGTAHKITFTRMPLIWITQS